MFGIPIGNKMIDFHEIAQSFRLLSQSNVSVFQTRCVFHSILRGEAEFPTPLEERGEHATTIRPWTQRRAVTQFVSDRLEQSEKEIGHRQKAVRQAMKSLELAKDQTE
jgi:hypothetical protein